MSSEHEAFDSLVLNGPRDYTLILVITSGTERFPCPVCLYVRRCEHLNILGDDFADSKLIMTFFPL